MTFERMKKPELIATYLDITGQTDLDAVAYPSTRVLLIEAIRDKLQGQSEAARNVKLSPPSLCHISAKSVNEWLLEHPIVPLDKEQPNER